MPGSLEFTAEQTYLQPPEAQTDVVHVIRGVIEAENGAIEHYQRIIEFCDGVDFVTQDMVIDIQRDEQSTSACSRASCASTRRRAARRVPAGHKRPIGPLLTGARRLREERLLCCFLPA